MKPHRKVLTALIATSALSGFVYLVANRSTTFGSALAQQLPTHQTGQSSGGVVVELCDGVTKMEVKGLRPGRSLTHEQALAVTRSLMAEWTRKHPDRHWQMAQGEAGGGGTEWSDESNSPEATSIPQAVATLPMAGTSQPAATSGAGPTFPVPEMMASPTAESTLMIVETPMPRRTHHSHTPTPQPSASVGAEAVEETPTETRTPKPTRTATPTATPGPRNPVIGGPGHNQLPVQQGDTYASFNARDEKIWQANTERFIQEGKEVFHDADKLGSTIGISCDMCHPDAANTHPETYPKYQVQLQRVALLRDMIEWCIENPVKGKTMDPNDPRLRAIEAYILSQRKGVPLEYGKH